MYRGPPERHAEWPESPARGVDRQNAATVKNV